jgi:hypothetical protein
MKVSQRLKRVRLSLLPESAPVLFKVMTCRLSNDRSIVYLEDHPRYFIAVKKLLAMMFVCLALLTACSSTSSSSDSLTSSTESEFDTSDPGLDTSWTPAGFNEWDDNVAWKWVERESDCSDCIYWHVQIVTNMGCPNGVYSSINISENDEVVDWTNDSIPYLGPGQKAVLAFEKYGLSGSGSDYEGSLTELNCR